MLYCKSRLVCRVSRSIPCCLCTLYHYPGMNRTIYPHYLFCIQAIHACSYPQMRETRRLTPMLPSVCMCMREFKATNQYPIMEMS